MAVLRDSGVTFTQGCSYCWVSRRDLWIGDMPTLPWPLAETSETHRTSIEGPESFSPPEEKYLEIVRKRVEDDLAAIMHVYHQTTLPSFNIDWKVNSLDVIQSIRYL